MGFRILPVEDDCNTREMMQAALELAGADVLPASSIATVADSTAQAYSLGPTVSTMKLLPVSDTL